MKGLSGSFSRYKYAGADILALPSSDWRGIDPLHTKMAAFRSIEQGHSILRSTRFGLSAAIIPYGEMTSKMISFDHNNKIMMAHVPAKSIRTVYSTVGDILVYLSIAFLLIWIAVDTLQQIVPNLFMYSDFDKSSNIYQNLVNSGELKILENAEITSRLQILEETYTYLNRMENIHWQVILEHFSKELMDNVDLSLKEAVNPDVIYSYRFRNILYTSIGIMEEKNMVYLRAIRQIDDISGLIEKEFEK